MTNTEWGYKGIRITQSRFGCEVEIPDLEAERLNVRTLHLPDQQGVIVHSVPGCDLAWVLGDGTVWPWCAEVHSFLSRRKLSDEVTARCLAVAQRARKANRAFAHY
jgi:hypothetical protein